MMNEIKKFWVESEEEENMFENLVGDFTEAESATEAIELYKAWLIEHDEHSEYVADTMVYRVKAEKIEDGVKELLPVTLYKFSEYRDRGGIGSEELFDTAEQAIAHAKKMWKMMCDKDKKSYINDKCGEFCVSEYIPYTIEKRIWSAF